MRNLHISAKEILEQLEDGAVLVDIRESIETEDVWIDRDNVLKIPYSTFAERKNELPKNKKLILCCAIGLVSENAVLTLQKNGYDAVYVLTDGLIGWQAANLPLKTIADVTCKCNKE